MGILCKEWYAPNNKEAEDEYNEPEGAYLTLVGWEGKNHDHRGRDEAQERKPNEVL
jgi:hypothetical protein